MSQQNQLIINIIQVKSLLDEKLHFFSSALNFLFFRFFILYLKIKTKQQFKANNIILKLKKTEKKIIRKSFIYIIIMKAFIFNKTQKIKILKAL